jgi:hypothetical protein
MAGLTFVLGGPKGRKEEPDGPPKTGPEGEDGGGGMEGARKDAARAVMRAIKMGDVDELDPALQAFVEACQGSGYSDKE